MSKKLLQYYMNKMEDGGKILPVPVPAKYAPLPRATDIRGMRPVPELRTQEEARMMRAFNNGTIRSAQPQNKIAKALAIAANPATAASYAVRGQRIPDNFDRAETNRYDAATSMVNPFSYLKQVVDTKRDIQEGNYGSAAMNAMGILPMRLPNFGRITSNNLDGFLGKQLNNMGRDLQHLRGRNNEGVFMMRDRDDIVIKLEDAQRTAHFTETPEFVNTNMAEKMRDIPDNLPISKTLYQLDDIRMKGSKVPLRASFMSRVKGVPGSQIQPSDFVNIPETAYQEMYNNLKLLRNNDLAYDYFGNNYLYNQNTRQFGLFDIGLQPKKTGYWADDVFGASSKELYGVEKSAENIKNAMREKFSGDFRYTMEPEFDAFHNGQGNFDFNTLQAITAEGSRRVSNRIQNSLKNLDPYEDGGENDPDEPTLMRNRRVGTIRKPLSKVNLRPIYDLKKPVWEDWYVKNCPDGVGCSKQATMLAQKITGLPYSSYAPADAGYRDAVSKRYGLTNVFDQEGEQKTNANSQDEGWKYPTNEDFKKWKAGDIVTLDRGSDTWFSYNAPSGFSEKDNSGLSHNGTVKGFTKEGRPIIQHGYQTGRNRGKSITEILNKDNRVSSFGHGKYAVKSVWRPKEVNEDGTIDTVVNVVDSAEDRANRKKNTTTNQSFYIKDDYTNVNSPAAHFSGAVSRYNTKQQLVSMFNNEELDKELQYKLGMTADEVDNMKPVIYGVFGQETNFNDVDNIGAAPKEILGSMLGIGSRGPAQIKLDSLSKDERKVLGIKRASDLEKEDVSYKAAMLLLNNARKRMNMEVEQGTHPELQDADEYFRSGYYYNSPARSINTAEQWGKKNKPVTLNPLTWLNKLSTRERPGVFASVNPNYAEQAELRMDKGSYPYKLMEKARDLGVDVDFENAANLEEVVVRGSKKGSNYKKLVDGGFLNRTITCSNCGHSWEAVDGGTDPLTCHKCGGLVKMYDGGETDGTSTKKPLVKLSPDQMHMEKLRHYAQRASKKEQPTVQSRGSMPDSFRQKLFQDAQNAALRNQLLKGADIVTDVMQVGNFIPHPIGQAIGKAGNAAGAWVDAAQAAGDVYNGNYASAAINAASVALPNILANNEFRRNSKYLRPGQPLYPLSPQAGIIPGGYSRTNYIEPFTKVKGMTDKSLLANRALLGALGAETVYDSYKNGGQHGGLDRWFAEKWVDVKSGKPCGRQEGESRAYPACRPSRRVNSNTPKTSSEMSAAEKAKFKREKTSSQRISYNHQRNN